MRAFSLGSVILGFAVVAGATTVSIDLTATGGATLSGGTANGTILDATSAPTTVGTGVIDSFVRMQANGGGTSEQGYNTDASNVDDNKGGVFTHSILFSSLDATTKPGYFTFLLDINQTGTNPDLSLDAIQLYTASSGSLSAAGTPGPGATLKYDFQTATSAVCTGSGVCNNASANTHNEIILNANNNAGSVMGSTCSCTCRWASSLALVRQPTSIFIPPLADLAARTLRTTVLRNGPSSGPQGKRPQSRFRRHWSAPG